MVYRYIVDTVVIYGKHLITLPLFILLFSTVISNIVLEVQS